MLSRQVSHVQPTTQLPRRRGVASLAEVTVVGAAAARRSYVASGASMIPGSPSVRTWWSIHVTVWFGASPRSVGCTNQPNFSRDSTGRLRGAAGRGVGDQGVHARRHDREAEQRASLVEEVGADLQPAPPRAHGVAGAFRELQHGVERDHAVVGEALGDPDREVVRHRDVEVCREAAQRQSRQLGPTAALPRLAKAGGRLAQPLGCHRHGWRDQFCLPAVGGQPRAVRKAVGPRVTGVPRDQAGGHRGEQLTEVDLSVLGVHLELVLDPALEPR